MAFELEFITDAAAFLDAAGPYLARDPVVATVVSTIAQRRADGEPAQTDDWWLTVRDGWAVVGAAMRSAPFPPRPAFLLPMPEEAARDLARVLHERGDRLEQVNGALPATRICAEELARLDGGEEVQLAIHLRLFQLTRLIAPRSVPGRLRPSGPDDLELVRACFEAFMADADEQAGRSSGSSPHEVPDPDTLLRRIDSGEIWLWVDSAATPVHLTAVNSPSFGVGRIGPVYTLPEHRGRGYASAAVAEVSGRLLDAGIVPCLFTDQANPTSNHIYVALGYEPVVDMANVVVRAPATGLRLSSRPAGR